MLNITQENRDPPYTINDRRSGKEETRSLISPQTAATCSWSNSHSLSTLLMSVSSEKGLRALASSDRTTTTALEFGETEEEEEEEEHMPEE